MEIKTEKYTISYNPETTTITCQGSLLLNGAEVYEPILQLFRNSADECQHESLSIDVCELKFLNSSGINMMTKFVMYICDIKMYEMDLNIVGYKKTAWQAKLAKNLQRLMPALNIILK